MLADGVKKKIIYFFLFFIILFVLFQLKKFYFREKLILDDFETKNTIVVNDNTFILNGNAKYIKGLYLNGKEFYLDENDNFSLEINLFNGFNEFQLKAITNSQNEILRDIVIYKK
jgi:hypothetical protein